MKSRVGGFYVYWCVTNFELCKMPFTVFQQNDFNIIEVCYIIFYNISNSGGAPIFGTWKGCNHFGMWYMVGCTNFWHWQCRNYHPSGPPVYITSEHSLSSNWKSYASFIFYVATLIPQLFVCSQIVSPGWFRSPGWTLSLQIWFSWIVCE